MKLVLKSPKGSVQLRPITNYIYNRFYEAIPDYKKQIQIKRVAEFWSTDLFSNLMLLIWKRFQIVGVSRTTDYAQLCLLSAATDSSKNNQFFYYCNCYGHHGIGRVFSQCLMHYWECPLTEWTHEPNPFVTRAHAAPKPLALFNH